MADVFDTLTNAASAVFGGGGSSVKRPQQVQLDPQTQALINQQRSQALGSGESFQQPLNQGIEQRVGQLGTMGTMGGGQAQTGTTEGMNQALRNVYAGETQDTLKRIKTQNEFTAEQHRAQALRQASAYALHQQKTNINYQQMLMDAQNAQEAQRAQFVSAISGLASYGIGSYAAARTKDVDPMGLATNGSPAMIGSNQAMLPGRVRTPMAQLGQYEGM